MSKTIPIKIKIKNQDGAEDNKYILIEIQGEVNHTIEKFYDNMQLGIIKIKNETDCVFYIGNHYLNGKINKLKNPIVLCRKMKEKQEANADLNNSNTKSKSNYDSNYKIKSAVNQSKEKEKKPKVNEINVINIFKEKYCFYMRPTPILNDIN